MTGASVKGLKGCRTLNKDLDPSNPSEGKEERSAFSLQLILSHAISPKSNQFYPGHHMFMVYPSRVFGRNHNVAHLSPGISLFTRQMDLSCKDGYRPLSHLNHNHVFASILGANRSSSLT